MGKRKSSNIICSPILGPPDKILCEEVVARDSRLKPADQLSTERKYLEGGSREHRCFQKVIPENEDRDGGRCILK